MKASGNEGNGTFFCTVFGTMLSVLEMSTGDIVTSFILGGVGALGAYILTRIAAYIDNRFIKKKK